MSARREAGAFEARIPGPSAVASGFSDLGFTDGGVDWFKFEVNGKVYASEVATRLVELEWPRLYKRRLSTGNQGFCFNSESSYDKW